MVAAAAVPPTVPAAMAAAMAASTHVGSATHSGVATAHMHATAPRMAGLGACSHAAPSAAMGGKLPTVAVAGGVPMHAVVARNVRRPMSGDEVVPAM
jgi:hypothetical protein